MTLKLKNLPQDMQVLIMDLLSASKHTDAELEKVFNTKKFTVKARRTAEFPEKNPGGPGDNRDIQHAMKCPLDRRHPLILWSDIDDPDQGSFWLDGRHRIIRAKKTPGNTHVWTLDLGEHFPKIPKIVGKTAIGYIPNKFRTARTNSKMPEPPANFRSLPPEEQMEIAEASTCADKLHPAHCFLYYGDLLIKHPALLHRKAMSCPGEVLTWHAELLPEKTLWECARSARKDAVVHAWDVMPHAMREKMKAENATELFLHNRPDLLDRHQRQKLIDEQPGLVFKNNFLLKNLSKREFENLCMRSPRSAMRTPESHTRINRNLFRALVRMAPGDALANCSGRIEKPEALFCFQLLPVTTLEHVGEKIPDMEIQQLLESHVQDNELIAALQKKSAGIIQRLAPMLETMQTKNPRVAEALAEAFAEQL